MLARDSVSSRGSQEKPHTTTFFFKVTFFWLLHWQRRQTRTVLSEESSQPRGAVSPLPAFSSQPLPPSSCFHTNTDGCYF